MHEQHTHKTHMIILKIEHNFWEKNPICGLKRNQSKSI
jgi:hypothetical protein